VTVCDFLLVRGIDEVAARPLLDAWKAAHKWVRSVDLVDYWCPQHLVINNREAVKYLKGRYQDDLADLVALLEENGGCVIHLTANREKPEASEEDLSRWAEENRRARGGGPPLPAAPPRPRASHPWPDDLQATFGAINAARDANDADGMAHGCRAAENILAALNVGDPPRPLRVQIARAYFDMASVYYELQRPADARRAVCRARSLWEWAVADEPEDFYARTQLAACLNCLALMASDEGDPVTAERLHLAALAVRTEARDRSAAAGASIDPTERLHNLTYRAGVLCNLGNLLRARGDGKGAAAYYAEAIRELEALIPKRPKDRFAARRTAEAWEHRHGQRHYADVAEEFLANARWGRGQLNKPAKRGAAPDRRGR
jgi:hypothetical protein